MRHFLIAATAALTACATIPVTQPPVQSRFDYSDVANFYRIYDESSGRPDANTLQREYLDPGSTALKKFVPHRIVSAERLANRIAEAPGVYSHARQCMALVQNARQSFVRNMRRFLAIYPEATQADLSFVIGRNTSGGTVTPAGVTIGLEVVCRSETPSRRPLEKRLESLIAHEIAHASQPLVPNDTLLQASISEGVPELIAKLITGETLNDHMALWTRGKEAQIERDFRAQLDSTDLKDWIYNGVGTPDQPGDLAYWVGYRIAKSYYERASDKKAAIKRLLTDPDVHGILRDSGWSEGS